MVKVSKKVEKSEPPPPEINPLPEEIAALAKQQPRKDNLRVVTAESLGWMRRTDLDDKSDTVKWEVPSGHVFACHKDGPTHMLVRVPGRWRDKYLLVEVL